MQVVRKTEIDRRRRTRFTGGGGGGGIYTSEIELIDTAPSALRMIPWIVKHFYSSMKVVKGDVNTVLVF